MNDFLSITIRILIIPFISILLFTYLLSFFKEPVLTEEILAKERVETAIQLKKAEELIREGKAIEANEIINKIPSRRGQETLEMKIKEIRYRYGIEGE